MSSAGRIGGLDILPPLSVEQEREVLRIIQRGRDAEVALRTCESPSELRRLKKRREEGLQAETQLIQSTLALVRSRVMERGFRFDNEDLELAGVEGLVNALQRFDPTSGNRFSTYAYYWITKMVNQAIRQQAGLSENEMENILALQRLRRTDVTRVFTTKDIAAGLDVTPTKAREIRQLEAEFINRRFVSTSRHEYDLVSPGHSGEAAPQWIIETLRQLCGEDFDAFWQYAFRTMSIEEIAKSRGISRQAMSKRLEKCRRAVRESPDAIRLQAWFDGQ